MTRAPDVIFSYGVSPAWSSPFQLAAKRTIDVVGSIVLLLLLLPLLLLLAVLTFADGGRPVLYGQRRPGRDGESFKILKFRTMERDAEARLQLLLSEHPVLRSEWSARQKLVDDPRITRLGRVLRRTSLDELPQLINVLKGDMSLVGPRPVVGEPEEVFGSHTEAILVAKPGLTGKWAISGRHACEDSRADLEYEYVQGWSVWSDLAILARTPKVVLLGEGAY